MIPDDLLRYAAFTRDPTGGNPAGVLVCDELPGGAEMQAIAAEVGYSECAFLAPLPDGSWRTRYFAPAAEVPFCGHATIAAGVVLGQRNGPGTYLLAINDGEVPVEVGADESGALRATLTSVEPWVEPAPVELAERALGALRWNRLLLAANAPPALAFAGSRHLVLVLESRETLAALDYHFDALRAVAIDHEIVTFQLAWTESPALWHVRDPFPLGGVVEDPATGSAAAALGAYVRHFGLVDAPVTLELHQGDDMGRPSRLTVGIEPAAVEPRIRVSGHAVPIPRA